MRTWGMCVYVNGIFPTQGSNSHPLHSQEESLPPCQLWHPKTCVKVKIAQSCLTLCDPVDCSLPGSSVHGIFQARVLGWAAISFSRGGHPNPGIKPRSPALWEKQWGNNWGYRLLEGTNRPLCAPGPRRREQWPHKRLTKTCLWVSRSLRWRHGSVVVCCSVGALSVSVPLVKEVTIIFKTSTIVWPQVK